MRRLLLVAVLVLAAAGCVRTTAAPINTGNPRCNDEVEQNIRSVFVEDAEWAVNVAVRESGCDPCAYNPGHSDCAAAPRTAKGIFQLLGHDDLLAAACPMIPWWQSWSVADCNIRAAHLLYQGAGRQPWRL